MSTTSGAPDVFEREFLLIRAKILEVGAMLDRIDRAEGAVAGDPRADQIRRAIDVLQGGGEDRAEEIQLIFSLPYEADWRRKLGIEL